jgi:hypothetical protein
MHRPIEFCPNCSSLRKLDLSLGMMTINTPDGKEDVLLFHYHCASCNAYVRSTTLDHKEVASLNQAEIFSVPEYV